MNKIGFRTTEQDDLGVCPLFDISCKLGNNLQCSDCDLYREFCQHEKEAAAMEICPYCNPEYVLMESETVYVKYDSFPASKGHILIIPKRHIASIFDITENERTSILQAIEVCKAFLDFSHRPDGYNIGVNIGGAAGQTIPHAHIHVIPRYLGDAVDPRGNVRGVIPEKQKY